MRLNFISLLAIVIGAQIGSAIFMLPTQLVHYGMYSMIGWCIAGIGALSLALLFARLVKLFPESGGPPTYILKSMGHSAGFIAAWTYWVASWISTLPVIITIAVNVAYIFNMQHHIFIIEMVFLTVFTALNCYSIEYTAKMEVVLTTMKVLPLIIIPILLIIFGHNHTYDYYHSNYNMFESIQKSSATSVWGFIGLELATTPASNESNNMNKLIAKAMFCGVFIVSCIYALNTYSIFYALPYDVLTTSSTPYAHAMSMCLGSSWNMILSILIALVCAGTLNSWILATGQMSYGAAQQGLFPRIFSIRNANSSPVYGILIQYVLLVLFLILMRSNAFNQHISHLINISVIAYIMIFLTSVLVYCREGLYKTSWIIPLISGIFCLWIIYSSNYAEVLMSLIIPLSGVIVYNSVYGCKYAK